MLKVYRAFKVLFIKKMIQCITMKRGLSILGLHQL